MLSQLEHAKLASRITSEALDQKRLQQYTQIDDLAVFWSDVKQLVLTTRAPPHILWAADVLNTNIETIRHAFGLPKAVYDIFLNTAHPVALPIVLETRPEDQFVSHLLLEPLLTACNPKDYQECVHHTLICAQISLTKKWSARHSYTNSSVSMPLLHHMWCEAYTHLPEEQLFKAPDVFSQFSEAVISVFPIVEDRFPKKLGKLMNTALEECLTTTRYWVSHRHLEEWGALWAKLSFEEWKDVHLPKEERLREVLEPYVQRAQQKHNIQNAVQTFAHTNLKTKRKI